MNFSLKIGEMSWNFLVSSMEEINLVFLIFGQKVA